MRKTTQTQFEQPASLIPVGPARDVADEFVCSVIDNQDQAESRILLSLASRTLNLVDAEAIHPDLETVATWIDHLHVESAHTRRTYRREALRFIVWLEQVKGPGTRLARVSSRDAVAYKAHLLAPERAVSSTIYTRYGFRKAPWNGPAQPQSAAQTLTVLSAFYEAMRRMVGANGDVLQLHNPFFRLRQTISADIPSPRDRALSTGAWTAVLETIDSWGPEEEVHAARCRWLFLLAYYSWMRVHELAKLRMGDFRRLPDGNWVIRIQGKGRTVNDIAAPPSLMDALQAYRARYGLSSLPVAGDPAPALIPLRVRGEVLRPSAVYRIFKVIFGRTAARHPAYAKELEQASSHWMRHTGITHAFDAGKIAPRFIQKQARHKDPKTSSRYDARNEQQLADAFSVMGPPVATESGAA